MISEFNAKLFAKKIKSERIFMRKISLREASAEIGISSATLSRYETEKVIPDILSYAKVCDWLDVEIDTFFNIKKYYL